MSNRGQYGCHDVPQGPVWCFQTLVYVVIHMKAYDCNVS